MLKRILCAMRGHDWYNPHLLCVVYPDRPGFSVDICERCLKLATHKLNEVGN